MVTDCFFNHTFYIRFTVKFLQTAKNDRMMGNNHLAVMRDGLVNHRFSAIQRYQGLSYFLFRLTNN